MTFLGFQIHFSCLFCSYYALIKHFPIYIVVGSADSGFRENGD